MKSGTWLAGAVLLLVAAAGVLATAREAAEPVKGGPEVVRAGAMTEARAAHQATPLPSGAVLVSGGCALRGCERMLASAVLYDPANGAFRAVAPMAVPRASHAATALPDGRVLVTGGWTGSGTTASAELFDPATGEWESAGEMTEARASHIAVSLADGRVLIAGGGEGRVPHLASAEIFDPADASFTATARPRANRYLATRLADGRVLLTGGQGSGGEILGGADVFDPATGAFQPTGDMATARVKHAAALLPDGRVLIVGGSDGRPRRIARHASTEIYDPRAGRFSPGPEMRSARHKLRDAVVVLRSGAVLVAGGAARPELFDPATGAFVPANGELGGLQEFATATLLPSGEALVLGGYDERIEPSAAAWLVRESPR